LVSFVLCKHLPQETATDYNYLIVGFTIVLAFSTIGLWLVISFTHTTMIDWFLPGVAPTGKSVEVAVAVIAGFKDGKISHEHIYWDQASVLVQIGLLDPTGLPVSGADSARKVLDPKVPSRKV
jgi:hypothetical protein